MATAEDLHKMGLVETSSGIFEKPKSNQSLVERVTEKQEEIDKYNYRIKVLLDKVKPIASEYRKITLTLFGEPMPKQSVRSFASGAKSKAGRYIINHYQPKEMKERIRDYQVQICKQLPKGFKMFTTIVHVRKMHFIFSPLKSFSKVKGKMEKLHAGKLFYKTTKPDLPDNLKKLVNDSMSGLVYRDDNLIVTENNVAKVFGTGGCIIIELEGK